MGSRFFTQKRQYRMKTYLLAVCSRCKEPLKKATVHNALWSNDEHTGYLCDKPECREGVKKL